MVKQSPHIIEVSSIGDYFEKVSKSVLGNCYLLPRFISNLGLSSGCLQKAMLILERMKKDHRFSGKNPKSLIAVSIYLASKQCNKQISQRAIANELGVMETTIRRIRNRFLSSARESTKTSIVEM